VVLSGGGNCNRGVERSVGWKWMGSVGKARKG
jgi:hypothetical protein